MKIKIRNIIKIQHKIQLKIRKTRTTNKLRKIINKETQLIRNIIQQDDKLRNIFK